MLVWCDLETTGLSAADEHVLEVAAVVTTDDLTEVARFERVVYHPEADAIVKWAKALEKLGPEYSPSGKSGGAPTGCLIDPYVVKMHLDNGLWADARRGESLATVDADLAEFIVKHAVISTEVKNDAGVITDVKYDRPQLAGSTISFDRAFLAHHMPKAHAPLHYRNVDVTTLNEVARRFWKPIHEARPRAGKAAHRAMADILESIATARYYVNALGPVALEQREAA